MVANTAQQALPAWPEEELDSLGVFKSYRRSHPAVVQNRPASGRESEEVPGRQRTSNRHKVNGIHRRTDSWRRHLKWAPLGLGENALAATPGATSLPDSRTSADRLGRVRRSGS